MYDFLTFRTMVTPVIIQVLFWIGVAFSIIGGLIMIVAGLADLNRGGPALMLVGMMYIVAGPVVVRVYCELLILFFRMNETLTEIRNNTLR